MLFLHAGTQWHVGSAGDLKEIVAGKSWGPERVRSPDAVHANDARWLVQAVGRAGRSRDGDRCRSGQQAQSRADRAKAEPRKRQSERAVPTSLTRQKSRPKVQPPVTGMSQLFAQQPP